MVYCKAKYGHTRIICIAVWIGILSWFTSSHPLKFSKDNLSSDFLYSDGEVLTQLRSVYLLVYLSVSI
jgi:hypothetical protein